MIHPRTAIGVIAAIVITGALVGCGAQDPLEARLEEVGYTPQRIADELEHRLTVLARSNEQGMAERARIASTQDTGRGDGPGGNPFTFESIMDDIKVKIDRLQQKLGEDIDVKSEIINQLQSSDLKAEIRTRAITALQS